MLLMCGCAQIAGIDRTTQTPDAGSVDADVTDAAPASDAAPRSCEGGDAHVIDPATDACYVFILAPMPRNVAHAMCRAIDPAMNLASIRSASENSLIVGLIGAREAFIGGTDQVAEGVFLWDDGSPIGFTNWNAGEPNNGAGVFEEDCIVISGVLGGKWDDRPCSPVSSSTAIDPGIHSFVCARD